MACQTAKIFCKVITNDTNSQQGSLDTYTASDIRSAASPHFTVVNVLEFFL